MDTPTQHARVVGLDLAKRVFHLHVSDDSGQALRRLKLHRDELLPFFCKLEPALVAMEACAGAHHWSGEIARLGHRTKMLHPLAVAKVRLAQKNDLNDAATICWAATQAGIGAVSWKSPEQRSALAAHAIRQLQMRSKHDAAHQIVSIMAEFGRVTFSSTDALVRVNTDAFASALVGLPLVAREALLSALRRLHTAASEQRKVEALIEAWHRGNANSQLIATVPGVGPLSASALAASFGNNIEEFASGRSVSAWLGLVPRQHSTGGTPSLFHITKAGNLFLRCVLFNVGASMIMRAHRFKRAPAFLASMIDARKHPKLMACAVANRLARVSWALIKKQVPFDATQRAWAEQPLKTTKSFKTVSREEVE